MATMVTAVILSAAVTLCSAFGNARDATQSMSETQTVLRTATTRVLDQIRFSNRVTDSQGIGSWELLFSGEFNIWRRVLSQVELWADADGNGKTIESEKRYIVFYEKWSDYNNDDIIGGGETNMYLVCSTVSGAVTVIPSCTNPQIAIDAATPATRRICISFDLRENGITHHYEIAGSLWASDGHVY